MKKYFYHIQLAILNRLSYRLELFTSFLAGVVIFISQAVFWYAVFESRTTYNGFTYISILEYFVFARIVSDITDSKVGFKISDLIISGQLSNILIKPTNLVIWLFSQEFGSILVDLTLKSVAFIGFFIVFISPLNISLIQIFPFLIAIFLSMIISYLLFFIFGSSAFWWDNPRSINFALRRVVLFLSGGLVPLTFFPEIAQRIISFTPFPYLLKFPIQLLKGAVNLQTMFEGFCIELIWIVILFIFVLKILNRGLIKNEGVGI